MRDYLLQLRNSPIFTGMQEEEILHTLECQRPQILKYEKGDYIFREGEKLQKFGLILLGSVYIIKEDIWGNRTILAKMEEGQPFGESFAFMNKETLSFGVIASEKTVVAFLNVKNILGVCSKACFSHTQLIHNLLQVMAEANQVLMKKIEHTSQKTTRNKLLSYLSDESKRQKSLKFEIPFNRQQLAEYLNVDRSAMSVELSKLRDEGILKFERNSFTILDTL